LLTLNWLLTVTAVLVALIALAKARRATRRLERLTETYWELRYDHGQLRARVAKLDPENNVNNGNDAETAGQSDAPGKPGGTTFVPLSSLKR
jgi:hypothetical protein